jgi:hypothetical protein
MPTNVFNFKPHHLEASRKFVHADSSDESHKFHVSVAPLRGQGKKVGKIHFDTKVLQNGSSSVVQADATLMIADEVLRASLLWQANTGNHQVPSCVSDQVLSSTGRKAKVTFQAKRLTSVTVTSPPKVLVTSLQYVSTIPDSSATLQNVTVHISDTSAPSNYYYKLYLASGEQLLDDVIDGAESTTLVLNNLQSNVAYKLVVSLSLVFDDYETSTTTFTPQPLDINDFADWDGEKHVLRESTTIQKGNQLIHGKLHVPKNKTLTVYGNMDSTDTLTVAGTVHIHGQHVTRKEFNVLKNGSYHVHGRAVHKSELSRDITTTGTTQTITGEYTIASGGSTCIGPYITCNIYGTYLISSGGQLDNYGLMETFYYLSVAGKLYNSGTINNNFYEVTIYYAQVYIHSTGTLTNYTIDRSNSQNGGKGYLESTENGNNVYVKTSQDGRINNYSPNFSINNLLVTYPLEGIYANAGSTINVLDTLNIETGNIVVYTGVINRTSTGSIHNYNSNVIYKNDKQHYGVTYMKQTQTDIFLQINIGTNTALYDNGFDDSMPGNYLILEIRDYNDNVLNSAGYNTQAIISSPFSKHDHRKTLTVHKSLLSSFTQPHALRVHVSALNPSPATATSYSILYSESSFIYNNGYVVDLNGNVLP